MPIAIMGVVTNIINLMVLHQKPFRVRVTAFTLLRSMALADLLACLFIFPIGLCRCLEPSSERWHTYIQQFYEVYVYLPFANWFATVSVWLTLVVTCERYLSVQHAIKNKQMWTWRVVCLTLTAVYLSAFLICMPLFFVKQISDEPPPQYTEWGKSTGAAAYFWLRMLLIKILPVLLVAALNGLLVAAIWRLSQRVGQPSAYSAQLRQQQQMRATGMVISISLVYVFCHFPEPFSHSGVFGSLWGVCNVYGKSHRTLILVGNVLEVFSYASNFFFYCLFNRQFRAVFKKMVCFSGSNKVGAERTVTQSVAK